MVEEEAAAVGGTDGTDAPASKELVDGAVAVMNKTAAAAAVGDLEALAVDSEISLSIVDCSVDAAVADDVEYYHAAAAVAVVVLVMDKGSHKSVPNRNSHQRLIKFLSRLHSVCPCSTPLSNFS